MLLAGGGSVGSAVVVAALAADQADDARRSSCCSPLCIGAGLLGPVVLRAVAARAAPVFGRGLPRLAADDVAVPCHGRCPARWCRWCWRSPSPAIKVASRTPPPRAVTGRRDPAADVWTGLLRHRGLLRLRRGRGPQRAGHRARRPPPATSPSCGWPARPAAGCCCVVTGEAAGRDRGRRPARAAWPRRATLLPMLHTSLGTWLPRVPVPALGCRAASLTAGLVAPARWLPAAVLTAPAAAGGGAGSSAVVRAVLRAPVDRPHLARVRLPAVRPAARRCRRSCWPCSGWSPLRLSLLGVGLPLLVGVLLLARVRRWCFRGPARRLLGWDWAAAAGAARPRPAALGPCVRRRGRVAGPAVLLPRLPAGPAPAPTCAVVSVAVGRRRSPPRPGRWWSPDGWCESWTADGWGGSWLLARRRGRRCCWSSRGWSTAAGAARPGAGRRRCSHPDRAGQRIAELETSRAVLSADAAADAAPGSSATCTTAPRPGWSRSA